MDDLKQREQEHKANALRINAGRKPKFGDLMRNPWASERNPQRDGYFVRKRSQGGTFNPGEYYEFTDKNGKFWETEAKYAFFIGEAVPQANAEQDAIAFLLANEVDTIYLDDGRIIDVGGKNSGNLIAAIRAASNAASEVKNG